MGDRKMKFWQVDSFTEEAFKGNPAAVFVLEKELPYDLMQKIAQEMNLSETAFVVMKKSPEIRWLTPNSEVNLCGHATLAAAHILWERGFIEENELTLQSRSGLLEVSRSESGYTLDFPAQPASEATSAYSLVENILGERPLYVGSNGEDCMAVVEHSSFVRNYRPDLAAIAELTERGFLLTAKDSSNEFDYIYRSFFPKLGIPEDPVTGSANTCLTPYWAKNLGKSRLAAFQASIRSGFLSTELRDQRVLITGKAVTVFEAQMDFLDK